MYQVHNAVAVIRLDSPPVNSLGHALRQMIHTAVVAAEGDSAVRALVLIGSDNPTELVPLEEVERRYILHVLKAVGGSKTTAARILGLDRKTLYRKLKQYGIEDESLV